MSEVTPRFTQVFLEIEQLMWEGKTNISILPFLKVKLSRSYSLLILLSLIVALGMLGDPLFNLVLNSSRIAIGISSFLFILVGFSWIQEFRSWKKAHYVVTDKRIIILSIKGELSCTISSIKGIQKRNTPDGFGTLCFVGFNCFYRIADVNEVHKLIVGLQSKLNE